MPKSFEELYAEVCEQVEIISAERLAQRLQQEVAPLLLDVREQGEYREGFIPGAQHVPRSFLEMQVEQRLPDKAAEVVVYCAMGVRSAFAAKTLAELGYAHVYSLDAGFVRWKGLGLPVEEPPRLSVGQLERYARHLRMPEVGEAGQQRLLRGRVLLLGAGGLGSPAALYLAAAGVGTLGLVDADRVELSNLQRQILHASARVGQPKVDSAETAVRELNPDVKVLKFDERLRSENVDRIFGEGWDVVVDGSDNFPTRYLVNDAALSHEIPVVHGSIFRFEGQWTTFLPRRGPCYRCLYPAPPPPALAPSCAEAGVLGVLPGVIGVLQATEAIKLLLGRGEPASGRLLTYDALRMSFRSIRFQRDPTCPACGVGASARATQDDEQRGAREAQAQARP